MDRALQEAARLDAEGASFVMVTVLRTVAPSSAVAGAHAVVTPDGRVVGFVGGECTRQQMLELARQALADGRPRRLLLSPDPDRYVSEEVRDLVVQPMTCHSGGTVELFLEPRLSWPSLVIVGQSPVAQALGQLAAALPWSVKAFSYEETGDWDQLGEAIRQAVSPETYVVVATLGQYDDWTLEVLGSASPHYLGVVASRRRGDLLRERWRALHGSEAPPVRAPAGLDLGSRHPGDIALSILAEMTQERAQHPVSVAPRDEVASARVIDPVCQMVVDLRTTPYRITWQGVEYGFCAAGCLDAFRANPGQYALR
ncbi:MAG: XdhC family protein [Firmicutes bacterium]|nr:XdhC family protein [Bacillota bacterium]